MNFQKIAWTAGVALAIFLLPGPSKAETSAVEVTGSTGWSCFSSVQDAFSFYMTWGIPVAAFPGGLDGVYGVQLHVGSWNWVQDQSFSLQVTTSSVYYTGAPPSFGSAITSYESYGRSDLPTLSSDTPPLADADPGENAWYSFPANDIGFEMTTGTVWFRLAGSHPGNQGDRACIRTSDPGETGHFIAVSGEDSRLPTMTLYYISGSANPIAEFPPLVNVIASGTSAFSDEAIAEWCASIHTTSTWISDISSSIGSSLCRVGVALVVPSATTTNLLIEKKDELMTQFPLSMVGSVITMVSSTTAETSVSSTELSFNLNPTTSTLLTTSITFTPFGENVYKAWVPTSTRMILRGTIALAIWWGLLFSTYALGMALFRKKHE